MDKLKTSASWYQNTGIQFECQGSGKCCASHGEYGYVYMSDEDRERMAAHLKLELKSFTKEYCEKTDGYYHLKQPKKTDDCQFLEANKCNIYEARPTQCRTWPFWPEVMDAKTWKAEVAAFCPGVGKGKTYSAEEIEAVLQEQILSEL